jgi:hypothetical protein
MEKMSRIARGRVIRKNNTTIAPMKAAATSREPPLKDQLPQPFPPLDINKVISSMALPLRIRVL